MSHGVLIVGHGVVGKNLERELSVLHPDVVDKYKPEENRFTQNDSYGFAFICVDTPKNEDGSCDVTEVRNALSEYDADVYVIKSTVYPGTTERFASETGKRIVFSPEYYGGTQHCNNFSFYFTIVGGEKSACIDVVQLLQGVYDGTHEFHITDSRTAELAKYMENCWLATKVSFCGQFFELAEALDVSYEELRELFVLDPRVNPSHTFVYRDHPWWSSHCLDKDVPAMATHPDARFLRSVIEYNDSLK